MAGGDWYESRYPRDVDFVNSSIPSTSTAIFSGDGEIYEINVSNVSSGAITLLIMDTQSTPVALVPGISIGVSALQLILYQGDGLLAKGGASWTAGSSGLVGSIRGRRTTGWHLDTGTTYCNSTGT